MLNCFSSCSAVICSCNFHIQYRVKMLLLKVSQKSLPCLSWCSFSFQNRFYHKIPFLELYEATTGEKMDESYLPIFKKKHPNIDTLSRDRLQCSLQILKKFDISPLAACKDMHVLCMNPITVDNYAEILKECGFVQILPKHIIRYHTLVKSRTIRQLKQDGLMSENVNLEEKLKYCFQDWPAPEDRKKKFDDEKASILEVRMHILEAYLAWRLQITSDDFQKYCRNYLPLKHKPMSDVLEAIHLAQKELKFDKEGIRRNGFLLAADPINTKLILENLSTLAGLNICEVIRYEPAILKNNFNSLIEIRDMLQEHNISLEAQRRALKVFCMCPATVRERLEELRNMKEYQVLFSNPRVLSLVVHKRKMISRLTKIQSANKQCYSLNHLVSSSQVFNTYIKSFGNKICGRDVAFLICHSLSSTKGASKEDVAAVFKQLKRHKFYLHCALNVVDDNIKYLQRWFNDEVILNNFHLLLYPISEIEHYLELLQHHRRGTAETGLDATYTNLEPRRISDDQLLSLVLYEIEKHYHFTGDGIWAKGDPGKIDSCTS